MTTRSVPQARIPHLVSEDPDRLAELLLSHLRTKVRPFMSLPNPLLDSDVKAMARLCIRWAIGRDHPPAMPDPEVFLQAAAVRWARAGIPIEDVLHTVHAGFEGGLQVIIPRSGEPSREHVIAWTVAAMQLSDLCTAAISKAYVRELKSDAGEHHTAVHTLASALIAGNASSKMARECGIPIADAYYVVAVRVAAHPDENAPGLDRRVVAGRKLRRIQSELGRRFRNQALAMLSVDGGTVLLPTTACTELELDECFRAVAEHAGTAVTAIMTRCAVDSVPAAAEQTHELLDTGESIGIGPGLHEFGDLALQYQLTRPGIGRRILQTRIAPLDDHPELLRTLRVFFQTDMNRKRTARLLHIHPNTIDYRLRRIGRLTGIDLSGSQGLWYLRCALVARAGGDTVPALPEQPRRTA